MDTLSLEALLGSYENNGFKLFPYFTVCFGGFPSALKIILPIQGSKEIINSVLNQIELGKFGFIPVFKNWTTNDARDADILDDYAHEYVFKSESGQMLIHFISQHKSIQVHFLYNIDNLESEKWILETNQSLRATFGSQQMPKFKVLVASDGAFYTEDINTIDFQSVDISDLYNEDFSEIDSIISQSIAREDAGIILLHGEPGTGKTTYIKNLIYRFKDKDFIFIQNDFVQDLLNPSFVTFLLRNKNSVLIIEDAEKVVVSRDNPSDASVVSTILQLTDGLFSDFLNIKIVCTFNTNIDRIDKALLRKGRMIAKYNFAPLSPEKTAALAKKLGHKNVDGSLTLADIFGIDKPGFNDATEKKIGFFQV
ncbi:MAG: AAA family ATPase [Anaerolineales bacterium]|nr:AAA family ATPase [Anaerolineales bacterium]